jgi:aldose 1-epimerase
MPISITYFGDLNGIQINQFTITDVNGMKVSVINYGATITQLLVANKNGNLQDVILGFNTLDGYINNPMLYMGSICGRYANRIQNATFSIDGEDYFLQKNLGNHCLHGGIKGLDKQYWAATILENENAVRFSYLSLDDEEGFPGNVTISVTYKLVNNGLHILYTANTDKATPLNLTSHCYFNLAGLENQYISTHSLQLNATKIVEVNAEAIPTGNFTEVKNTAFDFILEKNIGKQMQLQKGWDHCWVLDKVENGLPNAILTCNDSGIIMEMYTDQPGIQFYSANGTNVENEFTKESITYKAFGSICLEAQQFPDAPNHPNFPNTILQPSETYKQTTIYQFKTY